MDFQLDIKVSNLGKIKKANIAISRATIFAGLNNTGKSYVSKFLYSLLDSLNTDLEVAYIQRMNKDIVEHFDTIISRLTKIQKGVKKKEITINIDDWRVMFEAGKNNENFARELQRLVEDALYSEEKMNNLLEAHVKIIRRVLASIKDSLDLGKATKSAKGSSAADNKKFKDINQALNRIEEICSNIIDYKSIYDNQDSIIKTYQDKLARNLLHNFQIGNLCKLIGADKKEVVLVELSVPHNGKNNIKCLISPEGELSLEYHGTSNILYFLKNFSRVMYLESPIYWKLEQPLRRRVTSRFITDNPDDILSGVPNYFSDLSYVTEVARAGKSKIKLNLEKVVGGKLIRNDRQVLVYQEKNGEEHALTATSTGVIQLAFLAYLVETQVVTQNAVIFIDEPEAHLHPHWQNIMIKSLFSLVKQGVNVVIATHSPDNIQWLQSELFENKELKEYVSVNHFQKRGVVKKNKSCNNACNRILVELTKPFANEYLRSL